MVAAILGLGLFVCIVASLETSALPIFEIARTLNRLKLEFLRGVLEPIYYLLEPIWGQHMLRRLHIGKKSGTRTVACYALGPWLRRVLATCEKMLILFPERFPGPRRRVKTVISACGRWKLECSADK